jgi:predicted Zn-dependent protease
VAKTFFEAIGYRLGQKAAQAKNAFDLMGGTDEESLRAEIRLGRDMSAALLERTPLAAESESTRFAAQIGHWLGTHVKEKKLPFTVRVTAEREPNAVALPGGPIFVSWPLLEMCQGQRDQISFLLGHEMAHIVRRHTLDRIVKDAALSLLLRQSSGRHAASAWLRQAGGQVLTRAFSRDQELEADAFSEALVRTAGGDPLAGESLLEKLAQATSGQGISIRGDYFATHPSLTERIANLIANLRAKRGV